LVGSTSTFWPSTHCCRAAEQRDDAAPIHSITSSARPMSGSGTVRPSYGSEASLVADVQPFINRHVDLSATFQRVATYYVILTWLCDAFNELP
jgi:hypothetical protein